MKRADKLANDIGKRLMTDRLIACMILTLLFLIFIIIVMKSFGYGSTDINGQVISVAPNPNTADVHTQSPSNLFGQGAEEIDWPVQIRC